MSREPMLTPPKWFLIICFSILGLAATAWAGWLTKTALDVQGLPCQLEEMAKDIKWIMRHMQ